jgi:curved DNA-binding protein
MMPDDIEELLSSSWQRVGGQRITEPRPGADVERKVVVTLQEAYSGTTRPYTAITAAGQERHAELAIPPGVATGTKVRFTGYGLSGRKGGAPGDLYLLIEVRPHPSFERQGNDLYHRLTVPLSGLAHGGILRVKTLEGSLLNVALQAGTQDGQCFRLVGQGMPQLHQPDQRGDLYVTVEAAVQQPRQTGQQGADNLREATRETTGTPNDATLRKDNIGVRVFLAALFEAGIGAALLLWWLIPE